MEGTARAKALGWARTHRAVGEEGPAQPGDGIRRAHVS